MWLRFISGRLSSSSDLVRLKRWHSSSGGVKGLPCKKKIKKKNVEASRSDPSERHCTWRWWKKHKPGSRRCLWMLDMQLRSNFLFWRLKKHEMCKLAGGWRRLHKVDGCFTERSCQSCRWRIQSCNTQSCNTQRCKDRRVLSPNGGLKLPK